MNEDSMTKTYAVTVRWPAVAERVEYIDAASVEEACDLVMRGEAKDLGDLEYHDDDAGDHWITRVELNESDDPRVAPVSLDVPPAYEQKATPQEMTDALLAACRMALGQLANLPATPAGQQTVAALTAAILAAEGGKRC